MRATRAHTLQLCAYFMYGSTSTRCVRRNQIHASRAAHQRVCNVAQHGHGVHVHTAQQEQIYTVEEVWLAHATLHSMCVQVLSHLGHVVRRPCRVDGGNASARRRSVLLLCTEVEQHHQFNERRRGAACTAYHRQGDCRRLDNRARRPLVIW